jgi:hypothetical protein
MTLERNLKQVDDHPGWCFPVSLLLLFGWWGGVVLWLCVGCGGVPAPVCTTNKYELETLTGQAVQPTRDFRQHFFE